MLFRSKPSITIELTPEEAEKLAMAQAQGEITVVLRSDIDVIDAPEAGVTDIDKMTDLSRTLRARLRELEVDEPFDREPVHRKQGDDRLDALNRLTEAREAMRARRSDGVMAPPLNKCTRGRTPRCRLASST